MKKILRYAFALVYLFCIQANAEIIVREFQHDQLFVGQTGAGAHADAISFDISPPRSNLVAISTQVTVTFDLLSVTNDPRGTQARPAGRSDATLNLIAGESYEITSLSAIGLCRTLAPFGIGITCSDVTRQIDGTKQAAYTIDLGEIVGQTEVGKIDTVLLNLTLLVADINPNFSFGRASVTNLKITVTQEFANAAPDSIVILTHGWQPGVDRNAPGSRLPELKTAIEDRLRDKIDRGEVELIDYSWPIAFTDKVELPIITYMLDKALYSTIGEGSFFTTAKLGTEPAGNLLAAQLQTKIRDYRKIAGNNYDPKIHFIGHSLGTMVNAYAVKKLFEDGKNDQSTKITVEQVTILDKPAVDDQWYYEIMPINSVGYVENHWGNLTSGGVGASVATTFPCSFLFCGGEQHYLSHNEIHSIAYANLVSSGAWETPILDTWNPPVAWNPLQGRFDLKRTIKYFDLFTIPDQGNAVEQSSGQWALLWENGFPASIESYIDNPYQEIQDFKFDYTLINISIPTGISLYAIPNGQQRILLWSGRSDESTLESSGTVDIPVDFIAFPVDANSEILGFEIEVGSILATNTTPIEVKISNIRLGITSDFVPGDLDDDGVVGFSDFSIFISAFGSCEGMVNYLSDADFDGDSCINFVDYQKWYQFFLAEN